MFCKMISACSNSKNRLYYVILLFALVLPLSFCPACRDRTPAEEKNNTGTGANNPASPPKVLCLGLDGLTWSVLHPMLENGELPHLARLIGEGASGPLRSFKPISSPIIWSSIATGKTMEKHGISGFILKPMDQLDKKNGLPAKPILVRNTRRCLALWNILSRLDKKVGILGWWATWPVEEVKGFMVSDRVYYDVAADVYPPEARDGLGAYDTFSDPVMKAYLESIPDFADQRESTMDLRQLDRAKDIFRTIVKQDTYKWRVGERLYREEGPFAFFSVYIQGTDTVSHMYWKYLEPSAFTTVDTRHEAALSGMIRSYYRYADRIVGSFLSMADSHTVVMVLSDHGLGPIPEEYEFTLNPLLGRLGYTLFQDGPRVDRGNSRLWDAAPKRTRARRIVFNETLAGEERTVLAGSLRAAFNKITTPDGRKLMSRFEMEAREAGIVVVLNPDITWKDSLVYQGKRFPAGEIIFPGLWSGDHILEGVLILAGPGIKRRVTIRNASVLDITPTVLAILGDPVADDMDGQTLLEIFTEEHLQRFPLRHIPTYETGLPPPRIEPDTDKDGEAEVRQQLESLGYLE